MASMRDETKKKRKLVIETALRMFVDKGFEQVPVDDIINEAGISKGTFYHYFASKDDIILEIAKAQIEVIDHWHANRPANVKSLEGHINRLFLDLASNIEPHPGLVRSLFALASQNENVRAKSLAHFDYLKRCLLRWLPDTQKVDALNSTYTGLLLLWSVDQRIHLTEALKEQLSTIWSGLRHSGEPSELVVDPPTGVRRRVAVIGGGLAGLTAAAYLSDCAGIEGVLFERSPQLGGRAFTYEKSGFTLNYGAHAIYGIDRHTIGKLEKELGLSFSSQEVDRRRVMYEKNNQITQAPLDFVNLLKTDLLSGMQKVKFAGEITAVIAQLHKIKQYDTLGDYLIESDSDEKVKELWEHLVCSNFFITPEDARRVPGHVINDYYQNLFLSQRPVNYILGSWAVITNQLSEKIIASDRWQIALKSGVESVTYRDGQYMLATKDREEWFDSIIFAMPVQQVVKLLKDTPWEPFLQPYENNTSTEVMVYDVGLSRVVGRPFSYISDMENKLFISDVSATDGTLIPESGQLLQGIAYMHDKAFEDEAERKLYLDQRMSKMEELFDRHYPGWREAVAVKRVSKKAMVQSVKNIAGNRMLPVQLMNVPFYFCGDGCEGKGELAERAFSSARQAAKLVME